MILFSGQESTACAGATSVGVLVVIAVAKTIAHTGLLGGGFRAACSSPRCSSGWWSPPRRHFDQRIQRLGPDRGGIAAAVAAVLRLPFTAVLLALVAVCRAGVAVTTPAIIGAVIGSCSGGGRFGLHREPPEELVDESPQVTAS